MKTTNYVIGFDLDGCIFDFEYDFCTKFGTNNRHLSNLEERYPEVDPELIQEFVDSPETYKDLLPIFGGITFVRIAQSLGFGIIFLTSRPEKAFKVTRQALKYYELNYNNLVFTKDKAEFVEKFNTVGNLKIRMMVDDIPANLEKLPSGVVGMCWEQPWNVGKYPRARYNATKMVVEYKSDTVSVWTPMFKEMK